MREPSVTAADVRHVAELARLDLDEEEVEAFRAEFTEILGYFDRLEEVPNREWEDAQEGTLRDDEVRESLSIEEVLRNAPETEDDFFKGPPVS